MNFKDVEGSSHDLRLLFLHSPGKTKHFIQRRKNSEVERLQVQI
jgi:hypothetical protein